MLIKTEFMPKPPCHFLTKRAIKTKYVSYVSDASGWIKVVILRLKK